MSTSEMIIKSVPKGPNSLSHTLDGTTAATAWAGYLKNSSGFGPTKLKAYAASLPTPDKVLIQAPAKELYDKLAMTPLEADTAFAFGSFSILALGPLLPNTTRNIIFVHTRKRFARKGYPSGLLDQAKKDTPMGGGLVAASAACRGWNSALLLLANGFTCDVEIFTADIVKSGDEITGATHSFTFKWTKTCEEGSDEDLKFKEDHLDFVIAIQKAQWKRKSLAGQRFAMALNDVTFKLQDGIDAIYAIKDAAAKAQAEEDELEPMLIVEGEVVDTEEEEAKETEYEADGEEEAEEETKTLNDTLDKTDGAEADGDDEAYAEVKQVAEIMVADMAKDDTGEAEKEKTVLEADAEIISPPTPKERKTITGTKKRPAPSEAPSASTERKFRGRK